MHCGSQHFFNHLVGNLLQLRWQDEAERLRGLSRNDRYLLSKIKQNCSKVAIIFRMSSHSKLVETCS